MVNLENYECGMVLSGDKIGLNSINSKKKKNESFLSCDFWLIWFDGEDIGCLSNWWWI